jgi:hypothetical protein
MANVELAAATSILAGNAGWNLTNTVDTVLLTVDVDHIVKINTIICANVDGSAAADLSLFVEGMGTGASGVTTTGADSIIYLAKTISVPADATLVILNSPIYLMEGDILKGGASATDDLDLFISYEVLDDA